MSKKTAWSGAGAAIVLFSLVSGGCDAPDVEPEAIEARAQVDNAVALNSAKVNGWTLNGWTLNGGALNGWTLNGWTLNGAALADVALVGSGFVGAQSIAGESVQKAGTALIGSELQLEHSDGRKFTLRFDDVRVEAGDVHFYKVSVRDSLSGTWSSLCHTAPGVPTEAIALPGTWDMKTGARLDTPGAVTLACRGGVLAKCVEWGYRPWAKATRCVRSVCQEVSLADYHQACTRMARADYCGDGTPHTFNNTPIDVIDRLKIPVQAEGTHDFENWGVEAEWGPNGAVCVGDELRLKMFDDQGMDYEYPPCLDALDDVGECGDLKSSRGGKLVNKYCDKWTDDPSQCEL